MKYGVQEAADWVLNMDNMKRCTNQSGADTARSLICPGDFIDISVLKRFQALHLMQTSFQTSGSIRNKPGSLICRVVLTCSLHEAFALVALMFSFVHEQYK